MSRGPIRHKEDLDALPKEDSFVFQDHLPAVSSGLVRYWKDRGLIQRVGTVRKNGAARRGIWEVTDPPMNWRACLYAKSREAYGRVTLLPD